MKYTKELHANMRELTKVKTFKNGVQVLSFCDITKEELECLLNEIEQCHRLIQLLENDKIHSKTELKRVHTQLGMDLPDPYTPDWED